MIRSVGIKGANFNANVFDGKVCNNWSTQWLTFAEQLAEDRSTWSNSTWSKKVSKIIDAGRGGNA
jgi:hypothetical protein